MKKTVSLLITIIMSTSILSANNETGVKKALYDLTTGNIKVLKKKLIHNIISNTEYYQSKKEQLKVRVVVHGDAYKFFMKDLNNTAYAFQPAVVNNKKTLQKALNELVNRYHVEFWVCGAGMKHHHLKKEAFYPFITVVHNAMTGLIDAQNDGYAYVPIAK
ncbi:DsrE family protein [Sulfurovum sp.]|uniref:DsrE family protein n=1 Tax=Sulfurovum sp. TaxID=1969726 RepID=UPI0025CB7D21|nr:DsrE family protein [Sulfurovum sp.]